MAEKSETGSGFCVFFIFFARQAKNFLQREMCRTDHDYTVSTQKLVHEGAQCRATANDDFYY